MSIEHNIQRIADALEALVELANNRPEASAAEVAGQAVEKAARRSRKTTADTTPAPEAAPVPTTPAPQPEATPVPAATPAPQPEAAPAPAAPAATPAPSVADCQAKAAALSAKIGSGPVLALIAESNCAKISAMSDEQRVKFFAGMAALDAPSAANAFE